MFTVAGVSTLNGQTKVRFANDMVSRVKMLVKAGHTNIDLYELPEPMTKAEVCDYLMNSGLKIMDNPAAAEAVSTAWDKYHNTKVLRGSSKVTVNLESLRARAMAVDSE